MDGKDDVREWLEHASDAAKGQRLDEAAELLDRVLTREPDNLRALDLFGFVRFFQGQYREAESFCRKALTLDPDHAYAHKGLGLCVAKQGKVDEGTASLRRAIALKPQWGDPYWDLGVVLTEAGRYEDALEVLAQGAVMVPKRAPAFRQFQAQVRRRREGNACAERQKA